MLTGISKIYAFFGPLTRRYYIRGIYGYNNSRNCIRKTRLVSGVGLTFALIGVAVKVVKGLIDLYEEVFIKRYFKRLEFLTEHLDEGSTSGRYLKLLKENEIFRLASGIKTNPEKSNILMEIYLTGVASNSDLKRLAQYFRPDNRKVSIQVDWFDKIQFTYSFFSASFLFVFGVLMGAPHFIKEKGIESISGLVVMVVFILVAAIVGRDYRTYRILKRVRKKLVERDMVSNSDKSIQWNFIRLLRRS